jgi:hypothetical protein
MFGYAGRLMPIDERWQQMTRTDWETFANVWLAELHGSPSDSESDVSQTVVMMNFTAAPDHQCQFIRAAVAHAESDDELGQIAAGPVEHLLGWHGEKLIAQVEQQAGADPKFARMLTGVWKYMISDEVWARVQAIQVRVLDPLYPSTEDSDDTEPGAAADRPRE